MDLPASAAARLLLPKVPMICKTIAWHSLSLSETARLWDLKTELIVKVVRSIIDNPHPRPLHVQQRASLRDPGVKGPLWVSKVTAPKPEEDDVRQLLFKVIEEMKEGDETYTPPELLPVEAEWTGYRAGVAKDARLPNISEQEKYAKLMAEVTSDVTILYFHGGAYYLMDPASHRIPTSRLAKRTGGRTLSVRYRLAPQNPFPAQLLDALHMYLYLLYPPSGSLHKPVLASNIVFAGDSAGGNLSLVLLQLILHLHRTAPADTKPKVKFHGQDVEVPIPGGLALSSPWLDVTRCMPSLETNAKYDYLPPPSHSHEAKFPSDSIWPSKPPRADIYCDGPSLCHPLISPMAAMDWKRAPPIFIGLGEEMLSDECCVLAQRLAKQGVKVHWEQYEAMPHVFGMMLEGHEGAKMYMNRCADFIKRAVEAPEEMKQEGWWITAKRLQRHAVDLERLTEFGDEEVLKRMYEAKEKKLRGFETAEKGLPRL